MNAVKTGYPLTEEQIDFYQKNRFIKLKNVLNADEVSFFNKVISEKVEEMNTEDRPMEEPSYNCSICGRKTSKSNL